MGSPWHCTFAPGAWSTRPGRDHVTSRAPSWMQLHPVVVHLHFLWSAPITVLLHLRWVLMLLHWLVVAFLCVLCFWSQLSGIRAVRRAQSHMLSSSFCLADGCCVVCVCFVLELFCC